jgi:hypothetical protein
MPSRRYSQLRNTLGAVPATVRDDLWDDLRAASYHSALVLGVELETTGTRGAAE